jgi:hypothetical protein
VELLSQEDADRLYFDDPALKKWSQQFFKVVRSKIGEYLTDMYSPRGLNMTLDDDIPQPLKIPESLTPEQIQAIIDETKPLFMLQSGELAAESMAMLKMLAANDPKWVEIYRIVTDQYLDLNQDGTISRFERFRARIKGWFWQVVGIVVGLSSLFSAIYAIITSMI